MFFGRALEVGCRAHERQGFVMLPLRVCHPGCRRSALDLDLIGPIALFGFNQGAVERLQRVNLLSSLGDITAPGGAQGAAEDRNRLAPAEAAPGKAARM